MFRICWSIHIYICLPFLSLLQVRCFTHCACRAARGLQIILWCISSFTRDVARDVSRSFTTRTSSTWSRFWKGTSPQRLNMDEHVRRNLLSKISYRPTILLNIFYLSGCNSGRRVASQQGWPDRCGDDDMSWFVQVYFHCQPTTPLTFRYSWSFFGLFFLWNFANSKRLEYKPFWKENVSKVELEFFKFTSEELQDQIPARTLCNTGPVHVMI